MDDQIITFSENNIYLEFTFDGKNYAVISKSEYLTEEDDIYIVKIDYLDNQKIARNIDSNDEYERVFAEFEKILESEDLEEGDE